MKLQIAILAFVLFLAVSMFLYINQLSTPSVEESVGYDANRFTMHGINDIF